MLTRRKLIMGAVATALAGLGATPALARDERLLADILYGVSDALTRDYIRRHLSGRPLGRQPLELRRPPPSTAATGRSTTRSAASRRSRPGPRSRRSIRSRSPGLRPAGILRRDRGTTTAGTKGAKTTRGATTGTAPAD